MPVIDNSRIRDMLYDATPQGALSHEEIEARVKEMTPEIQSACLAAARGAVKQVQNLGIGGTARAMEMPDQAFYSEEERQIEELRQSLLREFPGQEQ